MKKGSLVALLLLVSTSVFAATTEATVADVANKVIVEIDGMPTFLGAMSYVFGVALGLKAVLKFKESNESKGQVKLAIPIILIIASALFLGLPTVLNMGVDTAGLRDSAQKNFTYEFDY